MKIRKLQAQYLVYEESLRKTERGSELSKPWIEPSFSAPSDIRKHALSYAAVCAFMLLPPKDTLTHSEEVELSTLEWALPWK